MISLSLLAVANCLKKVSDAKIAAGVILGLEGTHENTFEELFAFYQCRRIIYAKLTFLTYNPSAKMHEYVKKKRNFSK